MRRSLGLHLRMSNSFQRLPMLLWMCAKPVPIDDLEIRCPACNVVVVPISARWVPDLACCPRCGVEADLRADIRITSAKLRQAGRALVVYAEALAKLPSNTVTDTDRWRAYDAARRAAAIVQDLEAP